MCRESTTRDLRLYFPCEESHTLLRSEKIHRPRPGFNLRTSDAVTGMITTGPRGSTLKLVYTILPLICSLHYHHIAALPSWYSWFAHLTPSKRSTVRFPAIP